MHSTDYPVEGCHCCEKYEPVEDAGEEGKRYDIYQTCVDGPAPAPGADGGRYQKCFNEINLNQHNAYRKDHSADDTDDKDYELELDEELAQKAEAYARKLKTAGGLSPSPAADRAWKGQDGKYCGESLLKLDTSSSGGLNQANWAASALVSEYFYEGKEEYDVVAHKITGDQTRGKQYA